MPSYFPARPFPILGEGEEAAGRERVMKVSPEILTVLPEKEHREIDVIMGGVRITLTMEEAQLLANGVSRAVAEIRSAAALATERPLRIAPAEGAQTEHFSPDPKFPGEPKPLDPKSSDIKFSGIRNLG